MGWFVIAAIIGFAAFFLTQRNILLGSITAALLLIGILSWVIGNSDSCWVPKGIYQDVGTSYQIKALSATEPGIEKPSKDMLEIVRWHFDFPECRFAEITSRL